MKTVRTHILILLALVASGCSALIYEPMSYEADGMYAAHSREEILENQFKRWVEIEEERPSDYIYRYDWWGYRPMYGHSLHHGARHHRYGYGFGFGYPYYHYNPYRYGWNTPYYNSWSWAWDDPYYYGYYDPFYDPSFYYYSPFWYSSCFYYDWFYYGHAHVPPLNRPGGGVSSSNSKRTIVRKADAYNSPSSKSGTTRNADGSTVGRSSSSSYYNRNAATSTSGYSSSPTRVSTPSGSSGGSSSGSVQRNSIGR